MKKIRADFVPTAAPKNRRRKHLNVDMIKERQNDFATGGYNDYLRFDFCDSIGLWNFGIFMGNADLVFEDYMQAQIDIAKMFNCQVVDLYRICSTLVHNNLATYTSDQMVHLNATGHTLIANIIKW